MSRPLTSIDPNTVALQPVLLPAPLPTVHHHHLLKYPSGNDSAENLAPGNAPTATEKVTPADNNANKKKRKSDSKETSNAPADKAGETAPAKKPKTSRAKKSDEAPAKAPSKKALAEALLDVSSAHLPGEDAGCVPVYETCDTIRRKIRDMLEKDGLTQAGYCRALAQATPTLERPPQASQLARFLGCKGPLSGNTSSVFYASYVLFEKLRIRDRKPKSKFRQEMEEVHGDEGVDLKHNMNTQGFTLHVTEDVVVDKYGHVQIVKKF
ncbi:hypothetical protein VPNG_04890 [Cytospora leucostoma]|uniref:DUF7726 domain-containing protein n=1 Tax=Cytospora leucostoma TaxID=1230097 RepID=A0A423XB27_9PEZI|nr:hypothetical protein VPNG_04890 [Cytospora leucostoma]